jgi:nucleoside-diphosphate-sugar epimerase
MSTILITGTSGFIGGALAASLADKHKVIGLSRQPTSIEGINAITGDFADPEELQKLDMHGEIDVLIHLAAVTGRGPEEACMEVNVAGSYRLLRRLIDRGTGSSSLPAPLPRWACNPSASARCNYRWRMSIRASGTAATVFPST